MAVNTNILWWVIVGAIVVIAIFLGVNANVPALINKTFDSSKSTIDISNFDKDEIKYQCFLFSNFKTNDNVLSADIENICFEEQTYAFSIDIYEEKDSVKKTLTTSKTIDSGAKINNATLGEVSDVSQIYDLKIKKAL